MSPGVILFIASGSFRGGVAATEKKGSWEGFQPHTSGYLDGKILIFFYVSLALHTFSAFWLRSSVVSVLTSLTTGTLSM